MCSTVQPFVLWFVWQASISANTLLGSAHTYVLPPTLAAGGASAADSTADGEVSIAKETDDAAAEQDKKRKRQKQKAPAAKKKAKDEFKNVF